MRVKLSFELMEESTELGLERQDRANARGYKCHKTGKTEGGEERHILGARGEYAAALALGLSVVDPHRSDLKSFREQLDIEGYDVRTRAAGKNRDLWISDEDIHLHPEREVVLVLEVESNGPEFEVVGTFRVGDAPKFGQRKVLQKMPGYFVPWRTLKPIKESVTR